MKRLPTWLIVSMVLGLVAMIVFATSQFATKGVVLAEVQLSLDPALEEDAKHIRTLFLVLYDEDRPAPRPWGAYKELLHQDARGVLGTFILTRDNVQLMMPDAPSLPKRLRIKARLDKDGQAGFDQAGDIVGEVTGIATGSQGVRITLDRLVKL